MALIVSAQFILVQYSTLLSAYLVNNPELDGLFKAPLKKAIRG